MNSDNKLLNVPYPDHCLLSNDTLNLLSSDHPFIFEQGSIKHRQKIQISNKGLYIVAIRPFSKNNWNLLVYNFVYYRPELVEFILFFLIARGSQRLLFDKEIGISLCVFDQAVWDKPISSFFVHPDTYSDVIEYIDSTNTIELGYIFNIIKELTYIDNLDTISDLIREIARNNLYRWIDILLKQASWYRHLEHKVDNGALFHAHFYNSDKIFSNTLFVVNDLQLLKNNLHTNYSISTNGGSQQWRAQINSMGNILNLLDLDIRNTMYEHYKYHFDHKTREGIPYLSDRKFSFKNIHMKFGSVRWYSTGRKRVVHTDPESEDEFEPLKSVDYNNNVYMQMKQYFSTLPINHKTQREIEEFLLDHSIYIQALEDNKNKNKIIDYSLISSDLTELFMSKSNSIYQSIEKYRKRVYDVVPKKENEKSMYYISKILKNVPNNKITSILFGKVLSIVSSYKTYSNLATNIFIDCGKDIINVFLYNEYNDYVKAEELDYKSYKLSDWKMDNEATVKLYSNDQMYGSVGAIVTKWLVENNLIYDKIVTISKTEKNNIFFPTDEVLNTLKDKTKVVSLPKKLPMIVKPKPYSRVSVNGISKEMLGGYLLNDEKMTQSLIIDKWDMKIQSKISENNVVYDCGNNLSSVGYKINRDVFDFIVSNGNKYNLFTYDESIEGLKNKAKLTKRDYMKLEPYESKKNLEENVIGIANAYYDIHEFYIPVRIDFRGRVNCVSEYLNYQSCELAKSLLLFSKPEKIFKTDNISICYFKAYGANCFGNGLDKQSWDNRIKWVDDNEYDLINFENGNLIEKADNKLLFIAFCLEYNRYITSLNNDKLYFETYLPIQLDATCNGYQHMALLTSDFNLAEKVNLTESNWAERPKDFYNYVSTELSNLFILKLKDESLSEEERESYTRLKKMKATRTILKKAIMTLSYGISPLGLIQKLQENFKLVEPVPEQDARNAKYVLETDDSVVLKGRDFTLLKRGIEEVINDKSFKLRKLIKYLEDIAKILTRLDLAISWGSPSGVQVSQSYLEKKEIKLKPFSYTRKTFSLKVPNEKKFDKRKQVRAFMPNIIHSLDASSLAMLVYLYFDKSIESNDNNIKNFFSIHDCFGVTANNIEKLKHLLQCVYTRIYTDNAYLKDFDTNIRSIIKFHYGDAFNEETLQINLKDMKEMTFPNVEGVLGTDSSAARFIVGNTYIVT